MIEVKELDLQDIQASLSKIETNQRELAKHIYTQEGEVRQNIDERADKLLKKIEEVETQVDEIKNEQSRSRDTTLRYVISVIVSFGLGILAEVISRWR